LILARLTIRPGRKGVWCYLAIAGHIAVSGGYPKIATVIGADLGKLAQLRPGTQLRFQAVPVAEAVEARRAQTRLLEGPIGVEPLIRTEFPSEFLLGLNLVDGVVGTTE
jgi:5-oxoprolinase (ATP-hydrolysing) subunit C